MKVEGGSDWGHGSVRLHRQPPCDPLSAAPAFIVLTETSNGFGKGEPTLERPFQAVCRGHHRLRKVNSIQRMPITVSPAAPAATSPATVEVLDGRLLSYGN